MELKVTGKIKGNFSFSTVWKQKRVRLKAVSIRGRKSSPWVTDLYKDLREEFERLRRVSVKFNASFLVQNEKKAHIRS